MSTITKIRPRKQAAINLYSERYYKERLKDGFDAKWKAVSGIVPASARLGMCRDFIRESWKREPAEFRDTLEKETEETFQAKLEEYSKGTAWQPRTAREYDQALQESANMVVPFADAIAQRLGMYVAVLMVGPLKDGKIGVRR